MPGMERSDTWNQMNTMNYFCNDPHCHVALGSRGHWTFGLAACSLVLLVCSLAIPEERRIECSEHSGIMAPGLFQFSLQEYSESLNCGIPRVGLSSLSRPPELCQPIQPSHYTRITKSFTTFAPPFTPRLSTGEEFTFLWLGTRRKLRRKKRTFFGLFQPSTGQASYHTAELCRSQAICKDNEHLEQQTSLSSALLYITSHRLNPAARTLRTSFTLQPGRLTGWGFIFILRFQCNPSSAQPWIALVYLLQARKGNYRLCFGFLVFPPPPTSFPVSVPALLRAVLLEGCCFRRALRSPPLPRDGGMTPRGLITRQYYLQQRGLPPTSERQQSWQQET